MTPASHNDDIPTFTTSEWAAIAVGAQEARSSLRPPSPLARAASSLFGSRSSNALADPKLDALRRFVVALRYANADELEGLVREALRTGTAEPQARLLVERFWGTSNRSSGRSS